MILAIFRNITKQRDMKMQRGGLRKKEQRLSDKNKKLVNFIKKYKSNGILQKRFQFKSWTAAAFENNKEQCL